MGLQSCKPCSSCLQSTAECKLACGCSGVSEEWRYCSDRCCDICCQMCVDVCFGWCSGDCSYTFCTLCFSLAQSCILLFTTQESETSEAQCESKCGCPAVEQITSHLPECNLNYLFQKLLWAHNSLPIAAEHLKGSIRTEDAWKQSTYTSGKLNLASARLFCLLKSLGICSGT